jgi:orotate phosphoribosyltransferase
MGIGEMLVERGAIAFGEFTLTSGKKSSYYVNVKHAYTDPRVLDAIAEAMVPYVHAEKIAGVALGAIPILVAVSLKTMRPFVMLRKEERSHGTGSSIEGAIRQGETVDIIEDVTTTGGSVMFAANALRSAGAIVQRVISVVDRGEGAAELLNSEGIELKALVSSAELLRLRRGKSL